MSSISLQGWNVTLTPCCRRGNRPEGVCALWKVTLWRLTGLKELGWTTAPPSGSQGPSQPSSPSALCSISAHLVTGYGTRARGEADPSLPCTHPCPITSRHPCTRTCHGPIRSRASAPPSLRQGRGTVVRGQWRLGGKAAALAAQESVPLQRTLRPAQGLVPEGPGAPQPGGALLSGR